MNDCLPNSERKVRDDLPQHREITVVSLWRPLYCGQDCPGLLQFHESVLDSVFLGRAHRESQYFFRGPEVQKLGVKQQLQNNGYIVDSFGSRDSNLLATSPAQM